MACLFILITDFDLMVDLFMVFNAIFNNISAIPWQSILLVETRVPDCYKYPTVTSHWQTVVSTTDFENRHKKILVKIYCRKLLILLTSYKFNLPAAVKINKSQYYMINELHCIYIIIIFSRESQNDSRTWMSPPSKQEHHSKTKTVVKSVIKLSLPF
jgi:hypothetical protein